MALTDIEMIRHTLATLAYRAAKAMRGAPAEFADFRPAPGANTPVSIVAHMGDLFDWALSLAQGKGKWETADPQEWGLECERFFHTLQAFDEELASGRPIQYELTRLFQGPIADAFTHTGQLAMLRRLAGCPMRGESYNRADIAIGRVGSEQVSPDPKFEFN